MNRRGLLKIGLAGLALLAFSGHTPYRQWAVYRQRKLLIGTSKADPQSYPIGQQVAETLQAHLPESQAQVSRAPDAWRLASLITSGQIALIILPRNDAAALQGGRPPFSDFGTVPLRALFQFGDYLLICRPDFPDRHAYLLARTLTGQAAALPAAGPVAATEGPVAVHPGALAYANGQALPDPPAAVETDAHSETHSH